MKLELEAKTKEQVLVKAYLEANVSDLLADKINNGTPLVKDGKTLINKKTLDGFMKYASDEARKLASKGANSACVEDKVVYGWAIHYFEENGVEETLYNEDGTEYKPTPKTPSAQVRKVEPPKPAQRQASLFDFMEEAKPEPEVKDDDEDDQPLRKKSTKYLLSLPKKKKQKWNRQSRSLQYGKVIRTCKENIPTVLSCTAWETSTRPLAMMP